MPPKTWKLTSKATCESFLAKYFTLGLSATPTGPDMDKCRVVFGFVGLKGMANDSEAWTRLHASVAKLQVARSSAQIFTSVHYQIEAQMLDLVEKVAAIRIADHVEDRKIVQLTDEERDACPYLVDLVSVLVAKDLTRQTKQTIVKSINKLHKEAAEDFRSSFGQDDECYCRTLPHLGAASNLFYEGPCVCKRPPILRRTRDPGTLQVIYAYTVRLNDHPAHQVLAAPLDRASFSLTMSSDMSRFVHNYSSALKSYSGAKNIETFVRQIIDKMPSELDAEDMEDMEDVEDNEDRQGATALQDTTVQGVAEPGFKMDACAHRLASVSVALLRLMELRSDRSNISQIRAEAAYFSVVHNEQAMRQYRILLAEFGCCISTLEDISPVISSIQALHALLQHISGRFDEVAHVQGAIDENGNINRSAARRLRLRIADDVANRMSQDVRASLAALDQDQEAAYSLMRTFGRQMNLSNVPDLGDLGRPAEVTKKLSADEKKELRELLTLYEKAQKDLSVNKFHVATNILTAEAGMGAAGDEQSKSSLFSRFPSVKVDFIIAWHLYWSKAENDGELDERIFPRHHSPHRVNPRALKTVVLVEHNAVVLLLMVTFLAVNINCILLSSEQATEIAEWENSPTMTILLIQRRHATGLNLQKGEAMFIAQLLSSEEENRQAAGRLYRTGQRERTYVFRLVRNGSGDERGLQLHSRKAAMRFVTDGAPQQDWIPSENARLERAVLRIARGFRADKVLRRERQPQRPRRVQQTATPTTARRRGRPPNASRIPAAPPSTADSPFSAAPPSTA
jgi:hypothetical protein